MSFRLTIRHGPRVERARYPDLGAAIAALAAQVERIRAGGELTSVKMLREFEPAERVAARLEISTGSLFRARSAGIDLMGDGSVVAFSGAVTRRPLELDPDEPPYAAIARELGD